MSPGRISRRGPWDATLYRVLGVLLLAISVFGFLNAFVFKMHGPGGDLGVVALVLAGGAFYAAHDVARPSSS